MIGFVALVLVPTTALAWEGVEEMENQLSDFVNRTVTVSNKQEQKASDTPGIVTIYKQRDIENLGYYTLAELAKITPGFNSIVSYGEANFIVRGQKSGGFDNNKVLILIDGIPMNHLRNYRGMMEQELVLWGIDRVEFMRGPGSSLYGSSAFYGVISIVTRKAAEVGTFSQNKFGVGSQNGRQLLSAIQNKGESTSFKITLGYTQHEADVRFAGNDGGSPSTPSVTPNTSNSNKRSWDDHKFLSLNVSGRVDKGVLEGVEPFFFYEGKSGGMREYYWGINGSPFNYPYDWMEWENIATGVKYHRSLSERWSIDSWAKYGTSTEHTYNQNAVTPATPQSGFNYSAYDLKFENIAALVEASYKTTFNSNVTVGTQVDERRQRGGDAGSWEAAGNNYTNNGYTSQSAVFSTYGFYGQYQQDVQGFLAGTQFTAGARYDIGTNGSFNFSQFSPRLAAVQRLNDSLNLKLLYGRAMRAPDMKSVLQNEQAQVEHPAVIYPRSYNPEAITTYEAGLVWTRPRYQASITAFKNVTKDALDRVTLVDGVTNFGYTANSSGVTTAYGLEMDFRSFMTSDSELFGNYSIARALLEKDGQHSELVDVPVMNANLGGSYTFRVPFELRTVAVARWVSDYRAGTAVVRPSGSTLVDLNFIAPTFKGQQIEFQVENVGNANVMYPLGGLPASPQPGRTFMARYGLNF